MKTHSRRLLWFTLSLLILLFMAAISPMESSLGVNIRLVYLHGAWVWAALVCFGASALSGLLGLAMGSARFHAWSRALGLTALAAWLTYLPMSLLVMQMNWGGLYFDEPRWRIPFTFAVTAVLLQAGLWLLSKPVVTSLANGIFAGALLWSLYGAENILHPDSPVFGSPSLSIRMFFGGLVVLALITAGLLTNILYQNDWNSIEKK